MGYHLLERAVRIAKKKEEILAHEENIKNELRVLFFKSYKLTFIEVEFIEGVKDVVKVLYPIFKLPRGYIRKNERVYRKDKNEVVYEYSLQCPEGRLVDFKITSTIAKNIYKKGESRFFMSDAYFVDSIKSCEIFYNGISYDVVEFVEYDKEVVIKKITEEKEDAELVIATKNEEYEKAQKELDEFLLSFGKTTFDLRKVEYANREVALLIGRYEATIELINKSTCNNFNVKFLNDEFCFVEEKLEGIHWKFNVKIYSKIGLFLCEKILDFRTWKEDFKENIKISEICDFFK